MPKISDALRDAQTLAEFLNMRRDKVEYFRHNYPDFVPQAWWDYQPIIRELSLEVGLRPDGTAHWKQPRPRHYQWQINQSWLRNAWWERFRPDAFTMTRLLLSVFQPNRRILQDRPVFANLIDLLNFPCPHQKAVTFLYEHPWRAKFCNQCQKPFVALERHNKYCSDICSHEAHTAQKRKNWHENKDKYQSKRKGIAGERKRTRVQPHFMSRFLALR
jgi:hypothetical protein